MHIDELEQDERRFLLGCAHTVIQRFEKRYPTNPHCLTRENVAELIIELNFCEITGFKFTDKRKIYPICINPFEDRIIGANQIALVARSFRTQYFEICNHISENIESPQMQSYIESDMRFQLAKELTIKYLESQSLSFEIGYHPNISELIAKSKIKNSREIMLMNINNPVIRNLIEKKDIDYSKNNLKVEIPNDDFPEQLIHHKIQRCIRISRRKGLMSDITFENSTHIFHRRYCQLTGMRLQKCGHTKDTQMPNTFTIDRINRFEGYNVSNIIVLCYEANQIKAKLEKLNYSEDLNAIIKMLENIKIQIYNTYKGKFKFKPSKALPVEKILESYIKSKNENKKRCYFE